MTVTPEIKNQLYLVGSRITLVLCSLLAPVHLGPHPYKMQTLHHSAMEAIHRDLTFCSSAMNSKPVHQSIIHLNHKQESQYLTLSLRSTREVNHVQAIRMQQVLHV